MLKDPDEDQQQATAILEKPGGKVAMSGPLAPVPADDFVLPVPTSQLEDQQAGKRSTDSSWSQRSRNSADKRHPRYQEPLHGVWRHTIGIILLLATVILWTASNFLASVGFFEGTHVAIHTNGLNCRPFLQTIATPNHTSSLMSIHHSSLSCCYRLLQDGYGPAMDLYKVPFEDTGPPIICLWLKRKSKHSCSLMMREAFKKQAGHRITGY